ncbi:murein tripeptide amidase MpaA [Runella defluvii]|uniref:carboxypeptidase T n=1 Tax=Runella defluvii TaxID=370973 RepID=A0A7W6EN25_9BACT|nr:M14 family zinc carboxypeptidase [Runella defluvii]MBB3836085.1 murein tripeptide amidase MpaA [Runella defluvii]
MKPFLCSAMLLLAAFCTSFGQNRLKFHRIQVNIDPYQLEKLFNDGLEIDHFSFDKKTLVAEISDNDLRVFRKHGIKVNYLIEDLEKSYQAFNLKMDEQNRKIGQMARTSAVPTPANFGTGSMGGFYTFQQLEAILDNMRALYPNLISSKVSIGSSVQSRPIYMVKISDNPDVDENEPELMMNALHHAREPMSLTQLVFFMWHLLENYNTDPEVKTLLNSSELYILPCLNPDGYVYNQTTNPNGGGMWRKNRRLNSGGSYGVDLNRNYGYNYALNNTGSSPTQTSDTYRGTAAFSEPETNAVNLFCQQHPFVTTINFHSYGNYLIYPFESLNPNNNPEQALFQQISTYFTQENGFVAGNAYQTVGYTANGTAPDWEYGQQTSKVKMFGFTPEVGSSSDGFWPASTRIVPLCNSTIDMNKKILRVSTFYATATDNGPATFASTNSTLQYAFKNFSLKNASYTVSISSTSPYVTSVAAPKTYTNATVGFLQTLNDGIGFTIDSATPLGTAITFTISVDNGMHVQQQTVTKTYNTPSCPTPASVTVTNLSSSTATVSWASVSGASSYTFDYRPTGSSTWQSSTSTNLSSALAGLTSFTTYEYSVKANCPSLSSTAATSTFQTYCPGSTSASSTCFPAQCYSDAGGIVTVEAENYNTAAAGTGSAASRSWSSFSNSSASGGVAMRVTGTGVNTGTSLNGPRLDYVLNISTPGTYYVWVRMSAGSSTTSDDAFYVGLNGVSVSSNFTNGINNNGGTAWTWVGAVSAVRVTANVTTPGYNVLNIWMREDGIRIDKIVVTNSSSFTPTGTGPSQSTPCHSATTRLAAEALDISTDEDIKAFPNPFQHTLKVNWNHAPEPVKELILYGVDGRTIYQNATLDGLSELEIATSHLAEGSYLLQVQFPSRRRTLKLIKKN